VPTPPPRLALDPPADAPLNFGRDEALHAAAAATGGVLLRVYGWATPTVSFGRHERARERYDADRLAALGLSPTRRLTGGRALVHTAELTYAVAGPVEPGQSLTATVRQLNTIVAAALRSLGVPVTLADGRDGPVPLSAGACFGAPSAGELLLDGRKLAGSAQWRDAAAWVQHGSILVADDQALLAQAARVPLPPPAPAATLGAAGSSAPSPRAFATALAAAWADATGSAVDEVAPEDLLDPLAVAARTARYHDPAWIWAR
jgi:lipoyl(octanoyl) transferase